MKQVAGLILSGLLTTACLFILNRPILVLPWGDLLDPAYGLYYTARSADHASNTQLDLEGLSGPVEVVRDERGVPHIFAQDDLDGVMALGYVVAQDRLFQMDFIPRVAAGRLAEVLGPGLIETDKFLRSTGMEWGAQKNVAKIVEEGDEQLAIMEAFVTGVNAYVDGLEEKDYPFEFRLLGYAPERYSIMHMARVLQYMTYDLTYGRDIAGYTTLAERLGTADFQNLYPQFARLFVPIIPEPGGQVREGDPRPIYMPEFGHQDNGDSPLLAHHALLEGLAGTLAEGYQPGKGSNNWAVGGDRSNTGMPILAGDMHLSLSLPAIWYELHMVTPSMNSYGVVVPGAPAPVEAFNDYIAWAFTNTGADQIDHYRLELNESGDAYLFDGEWHALTRVSDTLKVKDEEPVVHTLQYSHIGPVIESGGEAVAIRWVAHDPSRTMFAQWNMNKAKSFEEFQEALKDWDAPMQNILYADVHGNIAIRSTGYMPTRAHGHGMGLLDGTTSATAWTGRVPFDELPYSYNPSQGYLTSTNQQPADSTYPYYQGYNWGPGYRSLRIDALLSGKAQHTVDDLKKYQSDVYVVQRDLFAPLLDSLKDLSAQAEELRAMLTRWPGEATVERPEPLILHLLLDELGRVVWDEEVFEEQRKPNDARLYYLLAEETESKWLDIENTPVVEQADDVLHLALEATADTLEARYGWDRAAWRWGDHHKVVFRHLTQNQSLRPLWRGPMEFPGFEATLSPAASFNTTHSASWRVVVDFSTTPPTGYGVYPGGQSGNPFSRLYDLHVKPYVEFEHYALAKPRVPEEVENISSRLYMNLPNP